MSLEGMPTRVRTPRIRRGFTDRRRAALVAAALAAAPTSAFGVAKSFIFGGTNNWRDGINWLPAGEPQAGDDAFLINGEPDDRTVLYNTFLFTSPTLSSVHIDSIGAGT